MHEPTLDSDFIAVAQGDGVLSAEEAFGLEALIDDEESDSVPEWLHDAVERCGSAKRSDFRFKLPNCAGQLQHAGALEEALVGSILRHAFQVVRVDPLAFTHVVLHQPFSRHHRRGRSGR